MAEFLHMGGYAAFVWPAYGLSFLVLIVLLLSALASLRRVQGRLKAHDGRTNRPRGQGARRTT